MRVRLRAAVVLTVGVLVVGLGCGGSAPKAVAIKGNVTYQGQAVTEGLVQFNDEKTGQGAEVELQADGSYQAMLPAGTYAVIVLPPLVESDPTAGPADPRFKKVKNIPEKYRSAATSGLTAAVGADKTVHDFDLKP